MIFTLVSIFVPLLVYFFTPKILTYFTHATAPSKTFLIIACCLFFLSYHLPSPLIEGKDTAFTNHFVGGGIFTFFLWQYIKKYLNIKTSFILDILALYALVSALGVANELFELTIAKIGIVTIDPSDTWWDLFANTTGAFSAWLFWTMYNTFFYEKN